MDFQIDNSYVFGNKVNFISLNFQCMNIIQLDACPRQRQQIYSDRK